MSESAITVGKALRILRDNHKVSRRVLSEHTGISSLTIKKIEYGWVDPKWSTICTLFMHFGVHPYFAIHIDPISKDNVRY